MFKLSEMKKISIIFAMAAAALGFSACNETWDDNPKLNGHDGVETVAFLNTPVMQDMPVMISQENREGTFHLTCSQPDFGYAAAAAYNVQVSLTEDFAEYREIAQQYFDCSQINPVNGDVASAIQTLYGIKKQEDLPMPYMKVYMRLRAYIPQSVDNTTYLSNVVYFNEVSSDYLAIWVADVPIDLFLRGGMNDWGAGTNSNPDLPGPWQFATGEVENTWVVKNVTIPKETSFKIGTTNWGTPNLGGNAGEDAESQMVNAGEEIQLTGGSNPGHLRLTENFTGDVQLRLEAGQYFIIFDPEH